MNLPGAAPPATGSGKRPGEAYTRLHGRWLVCARAIWATLIIPSLGLFAVANILFIPRLTLDRTTRARMLHPAPVNGYIVSLSHLYGQFGSALTLLVVLASLAALLWIAIGLLIVWRKSDDAMGLIAAFGLIMLGLAISPQLYLMYVLSEAQSFWRWPIISVDMLG